MEQKNKLTEFYSYGFYHDSIKVLREWVDNLKSKYNIDFKFIFKVNPNEDKFRGEIGFLIGKPSINSELSTRLRYSTDFTNTEQLNSFIKESCLNIFKWAIYGKDIAESNEDYKIQCTSLKTILNG